MIDTLVRLQTWFTTRRADRDDERGASLVEYALLVALIAIVCIIAISFLGDETNSSYDGVGSSFAGF